MNNTITSIRKPIEKEFEDYLKLFDTTLTHSEKLQNMIFEQIKNRGGKRLRPTLTLLVAKAFGGATEFTLLSSVALELLHTASLVHDDVVDNSDERRGEASVNSTNGNKLAVLLGDYIFSTALISIASTGDAELVSILSRVGQTLSDGEILQLKKDSHLDLNYDTYYQIIEKKTASLFEACCEIAVKSSENKENISREKISKAREFGRLIGLIFQIRDDIFDYLPTKELGKPAAKDMREGKITLPALYVLNQIANKKEENNGEDSDISCEKNIMKYALKVKTGTITDEEIATFIEYVLNNNGIDFAEAQMNTFAEKAHSIIDEIIEVEDVKESLHTLVNYFSNRTK